VADLDKVISEVFCSKLFCDMCRRYGGNDHEDLKGEVMLMILEMPMEKKQNIADAGYLLPYALQMARFQSTGKYTNKRFLKLFKREREVAFTMKMSTNKKTSSSNETFFETDASEISRNIPENDDYDHEIDELAEKFGDILKRDSHDQNDPFFYHSRLFMETMKYRSVRQAAKVIGIPHRSISRSLTEYKKVLIECSGLQP
jgi:hypothetical protein